jgi:hypothetical protein
MTTTAAENTPVETPATEKSTATTQFKNAWACIEPETKKDAAKAAVAVGIGALIGAFLAS